MTKAVPPLCCRWARCSRLPKPFSSSSLFFASETASARPRKPCVRAIPISNKGSVSGSVHRAAWVSGKLSKLRIGTRSRFTRFLVSTELHHVSIIQRSVERQKPVSRRGLCGGPLGRLCEQDHGDKSGNRTGHWNRTGARSRRNHRGHQGRRSSAKTMGGDTGKTARTDFAPLVRTDDGKSG